MTNGVFSSVQCSFTVGRKDISAIKNSASIVAKGYILRDLWIYQCSDTVGWATGRASDL